MQKLSEEQKKLIETHYPQVLANLKRHYNKKKYNRVVLDSKYDLPFQAISFIVEAALDWKPEKSSHKKFDWFATQRCKMRLIDQWRRNSAFNRYDIVHNGLLNDENSENLIGALSKNIDTDIETFSNFVIEQSNKFFSNKENKSSLLHKKIIEEYVVPIIKSEKITIKQVAKNIGVHPTTVIKTLNSKKMQYFVQKLV